MIQSNGGQFYIGIVEDRNDPLMIGRVKVRVVGLHTHDTNILPTDDLPWAMLMQPAVGGTGAVAVGPAEGTSVIVIFNDWPENQHPIVIGALGGVPQGDPVNIDKFEDEPLFKDDITPQGRKIPTTAAEATGNQVGPITGAPNPTLAAITQQSSVVSTTTSYGVVQNLIEPTGTSLGAVGGLTGSIGGVGSTYGTSRNAFESLVLQTGNVDTATDQFKQLASQSGPVGNAIAAALAGSSTLRTIASGFGIQVPQLQNAFNAISSFKSPNDLLGALQTVDRVVTQLSASTGNVSLASIVQSIEGGVFNAAQTLSSATGISTSTITTATFDLFDTLVKELTTSSTPEQVATVLNGPYSSTTAAEADVGKITVLSTTTASEVDSTTFDGVAEGSTPPVRGAYGGPNFGGASPVLEMPKQDMSKYQGGSRAEIPRSPPPDWRGNRTKATEGINALLVACDKYGLITNEQRAALLGIVGGECGWIPQAENAQYSSPDRLCQIFPSTFKGKTDLASQYCNWVKGNKGAPSEFFNFVYDPANNGRQLGNSRPGDGGLYYGRGFIQLTGRANYERYARLSGYPIDKNPDLLITDMKVSAEIAVLYLMDRVKGAVPTAHPGYFYAAKKSVGNNSADIAARKLSYYEYFYGTSTPQTYGYADKQAGNAQSPNSYNGALSGNASGLPSNYGFRDPHNKYPLKRYLNEPEVNRLARGVVKETIVALKESQRTLGIPIAMNAGTFNQPNVPYGAKYPYNRVIETESGHVQEFDDTPGYERIHTYHRSGTFSEIDANGTKVTKIVGDGYVLYDRNGFISIEGTANVTVSGNVNIFCRSDANIEVAGSAEMKIGGSFDVGVARDMNIAVEGDFSVWSNGAINLQAKKKGHILTKDNLYIATDKELHVQSGQNMHVESKQNANIKTAESLYTLATEEIHTKAVGNMYISTDADLNVDANGNSFHSTGGSTNIKAVGNVEVDGAITNINSGTAQNAIPSSDAQPSVKALVHGMVPPALGTPLYPIVDPLTAPPLLGEEKFMYELPEDGAVGASRAYNEERTAQEGKQNTYESESASPAGGSGTIIPSSRQQEILATTNFTADFKLSKHFTLGMMFDGGFNVRHKLIDQNGLTKQEIVANLSALCENILERYLEVLPDGIQGYGKKWKINSGYRMGTNSSDHSKGRAVDIGLIGGQERKQLHYELIQKLDKLVPYDQLILEYEGANSTWIHTGFRGDGKTTFGGGTNRKMAFTMKDHKTYKQGFTLLG